MKTLKDHVILYDAECPMCSLYTNAFVKSKMLDETGRAPYQASPELCCKIDIARAVNEIALINKATGEVKYGVEGLATVIANSVPVLKPILNFPPLLWIAKKLYAFISYNRRVIIPHDERNELFGVQPAYRRDYRILYLIVTWFLTAFVLSHYSRLVNEFLPSGNPYREYLVCAGQIFFQAGIIAFVAPAKSPQYLGNMMTISFAGALALSPVVILSNWMNIPPLFAAVYFMVIVFFMLIEHIRRTRLMALGNTLSVTWIFYRLLILYFIL